MAFGKCPPDSQLNIAGFIKSWVFRSFGWPSFLRRLQWHAIIKLVHVRASTVIVDLGAGPMQYSVELAKHVKVNIVAVDKDVPPNSSGWASMCGITILSGDGQALPFADNSVDQILMSSLLHMVPEPDRLLAECHRILKKNGSVVLSVPSHYHFIPPLFKKHPNVLKNLLKLPPIYSDFIHQLNERFHVGGPQGYYSLNELIELVGKCQFRVETHRYSPGWLGSLIWEMGVLAYFRIGNIAFHLLFLAYPVALLYDIVFKPVLGSEHIIKVTPLYEK